MTRSAEIEASTSIVQPVLARHDRGLLAISIFKFSKCVLLAVVGFGALQMLRPEVAEWAEARAAAWELNDERRILQFVFEQACDLSETRLRAIGIGCLVYAAIFLVEGIGLYLERRWAEYLTIVATGSLIPIELYEIAHHATIGKFAILAVNIVIVWYLVYRLRQQHADPSPPGRRCPKGG